jgi:putative copper export protein
VPVVAWIIRWSGFVALAALVGGFVVDLFVLPAGSPGMAAARRRLRILRTGCTVVLLLTTVGEWWLRTITMSGAGPGAAVDAMPIVLTRTHFGTVWIGRGIALLALLALSQASRREWQGLGAVAALGVALTVSLTGHASDWGDLAPTAGIDWVHVVAATTWTGGLFVLVAVVVREARHWPTARLAEVMHRFSRLAAWCLLAVVLSGAYASWVQVAGVAGMTALWHTVYGWTLIVKVVLVLGLAWWGAVNRYTVLPRLGARGTSGALERLFRRGRTVLTGSADISPQIAPFRLTAYLTREVLLALLVFGCTAILTESTPARHAHHLGPRPSMSEHAGHAIAGAPSPVSR